MEKYDKINFTYYNWADKDSQMYNSYLHSIYLDKIFGDVVPQPGDIITLVINDNPIELTVKDYSVKPENGYDYWALKSHIEERFEDRYDIEPSLRYYCGFDVGVSPS